MFRLTIRKLNPVIYPESPVISRDKPSFSDSKRMRGVGGPLLCIGDLLSDVGDNDGYASAGDIVSGEESPQPSSTAAIPGDRLRPSDLGQLFEEKYNRLIESLAGTDHSWTALTLELCEALKKADKLVNSVDSNIGSLLEKVEDLGSLMKRGDSAVATVKSLQISKEDPAS